MRLFFDRKTAVFGQQEQNTLAHNVSAKFLLVLSGGKVRDYRKNTSKIAVIVLGDLQ